MAPARLLVMASPAAKPGLLLLPLVQPPSLFAITETGRVNVDAINSNITEFSTAHYNLDRLTKEV